MTASRGIVVLAFGLSAGFGRAWAQDSESPLYVGQDVCLECHTPDSPDGSCTMETLAEHVQAYQALSKPEAGDIAALSGIVRHPTRSLLCLQCHATAAEVGPRWTTSTFKFEDGVQCEACHGPGSFHVEVYRQPQGVQAPEERRSIRRGDRSKCELCHKGKHSHREVLESGFRMPEADRRYKTPVNLATSPDGRLLYVVCEHSNSLSVVDLETNRVADEITVGSRPQDVAVSPDGRRLYVTNRFSDSLTVIDAGSREIVTEVGVGHEPHGVLTDMTGERIFVLNTGQDSISIIDAHDLAETKRLVAGGGPWSLALRPDGKFLHVTSVRPNRVRFRDPPHS